MARSHARSFSEGIKSNLCMHIIPLKGDSVSTIIFKLFFAVSIPLIIIATVYFSVYFATAEKQRNETAQVREIWYDNSLTQREKTDALKQLNSDFTFWLKIDNTLIDNPVYQAKNDEYYLDHNLSGQKSSGGALFLSAGDDTSDRSNDKNLVVYGHNMRNGEMFGTLSYLRSRSFLKYNPSVSVSDGKGTSKYFIFAVILLNASPEHDGGRVFDVTKSYFSSSNDFSLWRKEVIERSIVKTNVDIEANDDFLTLITPVDDFENARLVVMARKQRDSEESSFVLDAETNPDVRYPEIWYKERGLEIPK